MDRLSLLALFLIQEPGMRTLEFGWGDRVISQGVAFTETVSFIKDKGRIIY